jgi:hypothetical protein
VYEALAKLLVYVVFSYCMRSVFAVIACAYI